MYDINENSTIVWRKEDDISDSACLENDDDTVLYQNDDYSVK